MTPGLIVLLGSGETLPSSSKTHEFVAQRFPKKENPSIVILETPAGFEPNSPAVAGKIKTFLDRRLQNYKPRIEVLPARKKGTEFSPDNREIVTPILRADEIVLGPGSPTYGARQLRDSLAVEMIKARHQLGATLFLSSSATLAFSEHTMAVYEIYKVGEDLHWKLGVNYFSRFGLSLSFVPHWDNTDGGAELDTSCCYLGRARFEQLRAMLPEDHVVVGLCEHTSLIVDMNEGICHVIGKKDVVINRSDGEEIFAAGTTFPLDKLGQWSEPDMADIDPAVWQEALDIYHAPPEKGETPLPSADVLNLVELRQVARAEKEWQKADELRAQIAELGWLVKDTKQGAELLPAV